MRHTPAVTFEQLIQEQRPYIEQVIGDLARRHFLAPPEIDEFRATLIRAIELNDFELLRAFDGRSTWETYLTLVIAREFLLFQMELWGKWRPSPAARRLGAAGVLLEELVVRDGMQVTEAVGMMRAVHRVDTPRYRLMEMAERLRLTNAPSAWQIRVASPASPAPLDDDIQTALNEALAQLAPDDRLIAELRFRDAQPLTRIARMLHMEVRPVQRRLEHVTSVIGSCLSEQGLVPADVETLLAAADSDSAAAQKRWQRAFSRPSNTRNGHDG
jgi:hypothetical protein